jgi:hypothetical protein
LHLANEPERKKMVNFYTVTNGSKMKNASYSQTTNIRKTIESHFLPDT